jgi:hypothetical protein
MDTNFCTACGHALAAGAVFCSKCGTRVEVVAAVDDAATIPAMVPVAVPAVGAGADSADADPADDAGASDVSNASAAPIYVTTSNTVKKPGSGESRVGWTKKKFLIFGSVAGAVVIAIVVASIGSSIAQQQEADRAAEIERLNGQSLAEAFSAETLAEYFGGCDVVTSTVATAVDFATIASLASQVQGISDPRQASSVVSSLGIYSSSYADTYISAVDDVLTPSFEDLIMTESRAMDAPESQLGDWAEEWPAAFLESCGASESYFSNVDVLMSSDADFSSIVSLAASVPWYPDGFYDMGGGIAYRWLDPGPDVCGGIPCVFWRAEVIANSGCNDVYGEMSIEQNGSAVSWTNDTLTGLGAGQTGILSFLTYEFGNNPGSLSGKISELSCY